MNPRFLVRSTVSSLVAFAALILPAQWALGQQAPLVVRYMGTLEKTAERQYVHSDATQATSAANVMMFNPAPVGVSPGSAQTLTASFSVSGYSGSFTPTAALHYGLSYTLGAVNCTPNGTSETCTVAIKFLPIYPGGRKDALFLLNGTTRLATVLLGGVGESPFALTQGTASPVSSTPIPGTYIYKSITSEDGTLYVMNNQSIYSISTAGVVTQVTNTGSVYLYDFALDGAGVLYIFTLQDSTHLITYDTVQGIQGTIALPSSDNWYPLSVDVSGSYYAVKQSTQDLYEFKPDGTSATTHITPSINQDYQMTVDASADVFISGYSINEITSGGTQTQVNTVGASDGLDVDAAKTLYATRYNPSGGVAMLPASDYSTFIGAIDPGSSPLGASVGPDGTVNVSNYTTLDVIDRSHSQSVIDFGQIDTGHTSQAKAGAIYNGGNQPLTISDFSTDNADFGIETGKAGDCSSGVQLAPGAICQIVATFSPTHAGTFSTIITVKSDSLNASNSISTIKVSGTSYGIYNIPTPSTLNFGSQTVNTTGTKPETLTNEGYYYSSAIYSLASDNTAFVPSNGTCTANVEVGSSCELSVDFSPTAAQTYNGTITVVSYAPGNDVFQTFTFAVTGKGAEIVKTATPVITPPTGTYNKNQTVSITDSTAGAKIYYTTDGNTPTTGSTLYGGTFTVSQTGTTVKAFATATGDSDSAVATATYTIQIPGASLTPATLSFGNQAAQTTSTGQIATLKNTGNAPLSITGITIGGVNPSSFAQTNNCGNSLAAGSSCAISVTFTPASAASFSATLSVSDDAAGSPQTVTLTGTGTTPPAPVALLTPPSLSFTTDTGTTAAAQTATLKNTGNAALSITGITIGGVNPSDFAQTNTCGSSLAAGSSCAISVTFTPASAASFSATLSVSNDAAGSLQKITLSGIGTTPPAPVASLTPTSLSFSAVSGTTATAQTATLKNTGNAALSITGITIGGVNPSDFSQTNTCGSSLAAGSSCAISVTFTPASVTTFSATLSVSDNAAASPQTITLSGIGTTPPAPVASLTPTSLSFSAVSGTTTAAQSATLKNTGNAALAITAITIGGANPGDFAQTNTCGESLAAGSSCAIAVTFSPASVGSFSATLSVSDNAAGSPHTIALTGSGAAIPTFTLSSQNASATVEPGGSAKFDITVSAENGAYSTPVTFSASGLPAGATATFQPASVTPGSSSATSTLTIQVSSTSASATEHNSPWPLAAPTLAFIGFLFIPRKWRSRWTTLAILLLASLGAVASLSACGGGFALTSPKTYAVTVTGTSGQDQKTTTIQLTVQ